MLYDELIPLLIKNKSLPTVQRCVLFLRIPTDILFSSKEPASLFSYIYAKQAELIVFLENHTKDILRHSTGLIAFFSNPEKTLNVGLQLMSQYLCISLDIGYGWLVEDEVWISVARWKSERMSHLVPAHQLWVTKEFISSVQLPDGVGSFDGNKRETNLLQFPYCEIKDYRDI